MSRSVLKEEEQKELESVHTNLLSQMICSEMVCVYIYMRVFEV